MSSYHLINLSGRILTQKQKTIPLLQFCFYQKPFVVLPKPIARRRENESKARIAYVEYMCNSGLHDGLTASESGFVVHPEKVWLGGSPDAWVTDPSAPDIKGIAEFKCPYREAEMSLNDASLQPDFCCMMMNGKLHLKQSHVYYHQVQLQLYVASDLCSWCDFVVYTTKDIGVE